MQKYVVATCACYDYLMLEAPVDLSPIIPLVVSFGCNLFSLCQIVMMPFHYELLLVLHVINYMASDVTLWFLNVW